jgi:hypothetical protein
MGAAIFFLHGRSMARGAFPRRGRLSRQAVILLGTLPLVIGGVSIIAGVGGGLYWTAAGMLAAIAAGILNAWVLLVEILR